MAVEILNEALTAHGGLAVISTITDTTAVGQLRTYKAAGTYEQQSYTIKTRGRTLSIIGSYPLNGLHFQGDNAPNEN